METPLVSIIVPCYNAGNFIKETIESVINQTYDNWEMLIIDDCSKDHSAEIIKTYANRDSRIKYHKTEFPSGSPAAPRNIGLDNSKGEYIAFLDSDDLWLPNKLENQLAYINETGARFVYSNCSSFKGERVIQANFVVPESADYYDILRHDYIPTLTILLNKGDIGDIRFQSRPKEDYVFLLQLLKKGLIAYNTNANVALYRLVENSRSSNKFQMILAQYKILREEGVTPFKSICYTFTHTVGAYLRYKGVRIKKMHH